MSGQFTSVARALILGLVLLFIAPGFAAPANDHFADAELIAADQTVTSGSNVGATREAAEPIHAGSGGGKSVWWVYEAAENGFLQASTLGSISSLGGEMDTVLAIYTGSSVNALTLVAANDDDEESESFASTALFEIEAGTRYYIAVDGFNYTEGVEVGNITLTTIYSRTLPTKPAPSWKLPSIDGTTINSTNFSGKVTLVNFWATWCGPCVDEIPALAAVQSKYEKFGFSVIGISIDNAVSGRPPTTLVKNFAQQLAMNYPVVMSRPGTTVEQEFGDLSFIPTTFLVDRNNNIVRKVVGSQTQAFFEALVKPHVFDSIPLSARLEDGSMVLQWPALPVPATVEQSSALSGVWSSVSGVIMDNDENSSISIPLSHSLGFYRLRINP